MKSVSSFTHIHAIPDLFDFLSYKTQKEIMNNMLLAFFMQLQSTLTKASKKVSSEVIWYSRFVWLKFKGIVHLKMK